MSEITPATPVSMSDVARRVGVHPSTVSRALRNDRRIPEATRERIRQAVEALAYRPNPLVSALIASRRRRAGGGGSDERRGRGGAGGDGAVEAGAVLAFLTAWPTRWQWRNSRLYSLVFDSMTKLAWKRGYKVEAFWLREPGMTPERMKNILLARGIRGVAVCPLPGGAHSLDFDFSPFATVALGYTLREPTPDHVAYDYCLVMKQAAARLLAGGFKRIGFVTTRDTSDRVAHLSLGACLAERCLEPRRFLLPMLIPGQPPGHDSALADWVKTKRPDVIITPTQAECDAVRQEVKAIGRPVSENVVLVCLDCHDGSHDEGMLRDVAAEARAVVELLTSRVERGQIGLPASPQTILIGGHWREGA